ncbi:MAG: 50S ribosomal protein L18 [Deltaproteobacteria bacterium]|nr:50S ribosomal protein L18 [Deltaproteobacteria bacterium]MBN2686958.1 50S ribosomal protein L18 [Deltaproteobacteria bacterium]
MASSKKLVQIRAKRKRRVRGKLFGTAERPRLSVFRSARHIYVQAVADDVGQTIASASTMSRELRGSLSGMKKSEAAKKVGALLAQKLTARNVTAAVFDRGPFLYHGRVKALAEGAREAGLQF